MAIYWLDNDIWFPLVEEAVHDGLLAVGGDLRMERLIFAYENGIFPWYNEGEEPMWFAPDPRFVLFPDELKISKSMKQVINKGHFEFRVNTAFEQVIDNCATVPRKDQPGTWISPDIKKAYTSLHNLGLAHCAETWYGGQLVGGLYGVLLGHVFYGESMFSHQSNASKFAFIAWVSLLKNKGIKLIDCQVHTHHLESLGARMIPRTEFMGMLPFATL